MSRSIEAYTNTVSGHKPRVQHRTSTLRFLAIGCTVVCGMSYPLGLSALAQDIAASAPRATVAAAQPQAGWRMHEGTVKKGQSALTIFHHVGVNTAQVLRLQQCVRATYDLNRLHRGQFYRIQIRPDGQLQRFIYHINPDQRLRIEWHEPRCVAQVESIPYERHERIVSGRITSSLSHALANQGESVRLGEDIADVFARVVDFETDVRPGDTFHVLTEERSHAGAPPRYHRILAAELVNQDRVLQAVYYDDHNARGYYLPDGQSLQGMFLRAPLRYTRISSPFSPRRFHPILKRYRPHWGVDYAAPYGTPVRSIGQGLVQWVGHEKQGGQMIRIRHKEGYMSYYLHLSRFADGRQAGAQVEKGQVIGYVGTTGLATGPHLDFRLKKHGRYLNPLTQGNVEAPSLPLAALSTFRPYAQRLLAKLHGQSEPIGGAITMAHR